MATLGTGTFKPERNLAFQTKISSPSVSTIVTIYGVAIIYCQMTCISLTVPHI